MNLTFKTLILHIFIISDIDTDMVRGAHPVKDALEDVRSVVF